MERRSLVEERVVHLRVNGTAVACWTASPGAPTALAAGWLLAEGFIDSAGELLRLAVEEKPERVAITAEVTPERARSTLRERRHRLEHGCGTRHYLDREPGALLRRTDPAPVPAAEALHALFRSLFTGEADGLRGGVHVAALSDGERLLERVIEVGRHNAVDRAIGTGLLAGHDLTRLGLVLSARISAEIALKAARARLSWVASRSVPTTLALEIARHAGLPLVARAAAADAVVHR
jgi:FdhD protein